MPSWVRWNTLAGVPFLTVDKRTRRDEDLPTALDQDILLRPHTTQKATIPTASDQNILLRPHTVTKQLSPHPQLTFTGGRAGGRARGDTANESRTCIDLPGRAGRRTLRPV